MANQARQYRNIPKCTMIWEVLEAAAKERKNSDKVIVLQHYKLMRKNIMFKYFVKGTPDCRALGQIKKEKLFVQLLESIHGKDSQLLVSMINKEKIPKLTSKTILEAFPGLYE